MSDQEKKVRFRKRLQEQRDEELIAAEGTQAGEEGAAAATQRALLIASQAPEKDVKLSFRRKSDKLKGQNRAQQKPPTPQQPQPQAQPQPSPHSLSPGSQHSGAAFSGAGSAYAQNSPEAADLLDQMFVKDSPASQYQVNMVANFYVACWFFVPGCICMLPRNPKPLFLPFLQYPTSNASSTSVRDPTADFDQKDAGAEGMLLLEDAEEEGEDDTDNLFDLEGIEPSFGAPENVQARKKKTQRRSFPIGIVPVKYWYNYFVRREISRSTEGDFLTIKRIQG